MVIFHSNSLLGKCSCAHCEEFYTYTFFTPSAHHRLDFHDKTQVTFCFSFSRFIPFSISMTQLWFLTTLRKLKLLWRFFYLSFGVPARPRPAPRSLPSLMSFSVSSLSWFGGSVISSVISKNPLERHLTVVYFVIAKKRDQSGKICIFSFFWKLKLESWN